MQNPRLSLNETQNMPFQPFWKPTHASLSQCGPKESLEIIQNKLDGLKQGIKNLLVYTNEVSNLIKKITELEIH